MEEETTAKIPDFDGVDLSADYVDSQSDGEMLWDSLNFNPGKKLSPEKATDLKAKVKGILLDMPKALENSRIEGLSINLTREQLREQAEHPYPYSEAQVENAYQEFCICLHSFLVNYSHLQKTELSGIMPVPPQVRNDDHLEEKLSKQTKLAEKIGVCSAATLGISGFIGGAVFVGAISDSFMPDYKAVTYALSAVGGAVGGIGGLCGGFGIEALMCKSIKKKQEAYEEQQKEEFMIEVKKYAESL